MAVEVTRQNTRSRLWNLLGMAVFSTTVFIVYRLYPYFIHWKTGRSMDEIGDLGWEQLQKNLLAAYSETSGIWFALVLAYLTKPMFPDGAFGPNISRWSALFFLYLLCYCLVMT